jgi:hypothetical protein
MNTKEAAVLVTRLFTAFGKQPSEAQLDEWVKVQRRFNYRPDDVSGAIDSLIATSNRMPTIAEFRTAVMSVYTQRNAQSGQEVEVPGWVRRMNNEHRKEDFEWWNDRFGSFTPQARALIGEACSKGKARMALTLAKAINEMQDDYSILQASTATGVPVMSLRQAIASGRLQKLPHDPETTPIRVTREALEAAGYSLGNNAKQSASFSERWERLKALTSGNTFTITPPAQVVASGFSDF